MTGITFVPLCPDCVGPDFFDRFVFRQAVTRCWRRAEGRLILRPAAYVEDRSPAQRRELAALVRACIREGGAGYGAFFRGELAGFALLSPGRFGSKGQYIDLAEFYVSAPLRHQGVGRELFRLACGAARRLGASRLYVSAHSAEETIAAYRRLGCIEAAEVNRALAEKEPFDIQMEYSLQGGPL